MDFAGDVAVSQAMIPAIVRTQVGSLLLAVATNLLIVTLLYRSLRAGIVCIAPTAVAVAWTFGIMGWLGVPLGVATSMFCAVTLGIGDQQPHRRIRTVDSGCLHDHSQRGSPRAISTIASMVSAQATA